MDNAWKMIKDIVSNLTAVLIGVLGLGIVAALAFGGTPLGLDVLHHSDARLQYADPAYVTTNQADPPPDKSQVQQFVVTILL